MGSAFTPSWSALPAGAAVLSRRNDGPKLASRHADRMRPAKCGYPIGLWLPAGFAVRNVKNLRASFVTNEYPGGNREDQTYNGVSGS